MIVVGYDLREGLNSPWRHWDGTRREKYLLRRDIVKPLSASNSIWPSVDERLVDLMYSRYGGPSETPSIGWLSLSSLLDAAGRLRLAEGVLVAFETEAEEPPYFRKANPSELSAEWEFLGWDVVDSSKHGAIADFGFDQWERTLSPVDMDLFRRDLNEMHIFQALSVADRFAKWRDRTIPDHAPFRPVRLSRLGSGRSMESSVRQLRTL